MKWKKKTESVWGGRGRVVSALTGSLVYFFSSPLLWNPARLSLQMSEAIDHLTVITQRLHRLPLDSFPPKQILARTANKLPGHIVYVPLLMSELTHVCVYAADTIKHLLLINVGTQFVLLSFSVSSPSTLHFTSLHNLTLNENYSIAPPLLSLSPHLFRSLPSSWEHPVIVLDWREKKKSVVSISLSPVHFSWSCRSLSLCLLLLSNLSLLWRANPRASCIESVGPEAKDPDSPRKKWDELVMFWYFHKLSQPTPDMEGKYMQNIIWRLNDL